MNWWYECYFLKYECNIPWQNKTYMLSSTLLSVIEKVSLSWLRFQLNEISAKASTTTEQVQGLFDTTYPESP